MGVEGQVAMIISVLTHHQKNREVKFQLWRSGFTVSHYVNNVLAVVLNLHGVLLLKLVRVSSGRLRRLPLEMVSSNVTQLVVLFTYVLFYSFPLFTLLHMTRDV